MLPSANERSYQNHNLITAIIIGWAICQPLQSQAPSVAAVRGEARGADVRDYGAKCDGGVTDDRAAVQAAVDAVRGGILRFPPDSACGVSSPGIFLYPENNGIVLAGAGGLPVKAYAPGQGSGLVAYKKHPPDVLLTNMAEGSHLDNLYLDCNQGAATNALVNVATTWGVQRNVVASHCGGDGMQVFTEGTPYTQLTSATAVGATSFPISAVTNNRITFGKNFCTDVVLDYGTARQEPATLSRVEGNSVITKTGAKFAHDAAATVRCHGNANDMHIDHYYSFNNGLDRKAGTGWGFRVIPGTDNNAIWWSNHNSNSNFSGGELWFGSIHKHYGGDYEGDGGPAIQLGVANSTATTAFMSIFPLGDVEESSPAYNVISVVCDNSSQINATVESTVVIQTGSNACPNYRKGSSSGVYGSFINGIGPGFWSHTANGYIEIVPGNPGSIRFLDSSHKLLSTISSDTAKSINTVPARGLPTENFATITDLTGPNCSDNAICAAIAAPAGTAGWVPAPGTELSIRLIHYALRAGANTLTLNGITKAICSHFDPTQPIHSGYSIGGVLNVALDATGCWMDKSQ